MNDKLPGALILSTGFLNRLAAASLRRMIMNGIAMVKIEVGIALVNDQTLNDLPNNPFGDEVMRRTAGSNSLVGTGSSRNSPFLNE